MSELSDREQKLIKVFLSEYKKMMNASNLPFCPRSLTIVSQPYTDDDSRFDFISYNKWFDDSPIQTYAGSSNNMLQTFLDVPTNVLMTAEELGKSLLSKKDQKKLMKALRLLGEIKLERQ